jgi:predicted transcriptional regulator of viral defense system
MYNGRMHTEEKVAAGPTGTNAWRVLDRAARNQRRTIRWPADSSWLEEITPAPQRLLSRMKRQGLLYGAGSNRYVIAPPGTTSVEQAAPPELLADLRFSSRGPYYLGFLSGLIAHRLTDLHSETTVVAIREGHRPHGTPPGFKIAELSPSAWPAEGSDEIERVRTIDGFKEFAFRSSCERTLVDGLLRPDLCAGIETVVCSWARARQRPEVSWDRVARIARHTGDATSRRVAFLLDLLSLEPVVERHFADLDGRKTSTPLDRGGGFALGRANAERDPRTGVLLNVPRPYLRGWIQGASIG